VKFRAARGVMRRQFLIGAFLLGVVIALLPQPNHDLLLAGGEATLLGLMTLLLSGLAMVVVVLCIGGVWRALSGR
jgi:hypothetical protein